MHDTTRHTGWVAFAGIMILIGVLRLFAAFSIFYGGGYGRWVGILSASVGAIGALLSIPGYPFWSLCVFLISILVVYGLAAYGGHPDSHRDSPTARAAM